jgi:hypothetical protein
MNSSASTFFWYIILAVFLQFDTTALSPFSGFCVGQIGCINYAFMPVITRSKAKFLRPSIHDGYSAINTTGTSIHEPGISIHETYSPDTSLLASTQDLASTDLSFTFVSLGDHSSKLLPPSSSSLTINISDEDNTSSSISKFQNLEISNTPCFSSESCHNFTKSNILIMESDYKDTSPKTVDNVKPSDISQLFAALCSDDVSNKLFTNQVVY